MATSERLRLSAKQKYWLRLSKKAKRRINIAEGAVRSSKTVGTIFDWIKFVGSAPKGDLCMVGRTRSTLYRNIIRPMMAYLGSDMRYFPGRNEGANIILWGREIFTFGADNIAAEAKIRGLSAAGFYGDEITLWSENFFVQMLARMSEGTKENPARFFGTTNPDTPSHWLKKNWMARAKELDMFIMHFALDENPFLTDEYKNQLKREYVGLWYRRFILGLWCVAEGAIYDFFDADKHVIKKSSTPRALKKFISIDYGTTNPTSFGLYGYNRFELPNVWREKGFYWDSTAISRFVMLLTLIH